MGLRGVEAKTGAGEFAPVTLSGQGGHVNIGPALLLDETRISSPEPRETLVDRDAFSAEATVRSAVNNSGTGGSLPLRGTSSIESDYSNLLALAISLEKMARDEIERISSEHPNDPLTIENNTKQRDLLSILAEGFSRLAAALREYSERPQPLLAGKAKEIADEMGAQFEVWWKKNAGEQSIGLFEFQP
jgi:hypothetical protein